jgi:hypothetical protein
MGMAGWDPVETTGLPDDIDFSIVKAEFGYDAQYADGEQILFMITASQTNDEGEPYTNFYSLGRAGLWETLDHGRTVVSQSQPPAEGFNKQSSYWKFIEAALGLGAGPVIQSRGTPDNAGIWEGLTFHMNRVEVDRPGLGEGKQTLLLPTAFLGDSGKVEASAPVTAPAGNGQPEATGTKVNILELKIRELAKQANTHDSFIEAVLERHPEASNDEDLFSRVLDENGIYAEVH